ncbi:unnamed protein product [Ostreobium quekettii]|uniref:Uncharacterized protein n=1 Tax=Ostreobium quekettii TaxID=121088 RepID=A0A8S1J649_9CHLO|nr:unnamed protein product [Ostreobium quekettii]
MYTSSALHQRLAPYCLGPSSPLFDVRDACRLMGRMPHKLPLSRRLLDVDEGGPCTEELRESRRDRRRIRPLPGIGASCGSEYRQEKCDVICAFDILLVKNGCKETERQLGNG